MGPVESFAWGALFGSLVTLCLMGLGLAVAVVWAQSALKKALWL
jgi:hypothetical protein